MTNNDMLRTAVCQDGTAMKILRADGEQLDESATLHTQQGTAKMPAIPAELQPTADNATVFLLKGKPYSHIRTISDNTGEAEVYLVENDGRKYVLKLYLPAYHSREEIMQAVWNINVEFVVHLYDFGKTTIWGKEREYELMEYLKGGTLSTYQLEKDEDIFRKIALQAAAALACLHDWNIIHKDIKPANFFFRDPDQTELVLGDFGISSMMEEDQLLRTSQARTPAFAAPEMYDDVIDGEVEIDQRVDYYSLGITLLYLWLGHSPFGKNERMMMRMKQEGQLPHIDELPEGVSDIIRGLTSINPTKRWGYSEVERWYLGEKVPIDTSSGFLRYKTFILDAEKNIVAHDVAELVPLLDKYREVGKQFLYAGHISHWLDECGNAKMAVLMQDITENRYPDNQNAGLSAAIYTLEPSFPYIDIKGRNCQSLGEVVVSLLQNAEQYAVVLQDGGNQLFSYVESRGSFDMPRLRSFFSQDKGADRRAILQLVYEIDPEIPFLGRSESRTLDEIIAAFRAERTEDEWESLTDGRLQAWLHGRGEIAQSELARKWADRTDLDIRTRGYALLYNLQPSCGFDLDKATSEQDVADLMGKALMACQGVSDEDFAEQMTPFISHAGRLYAYADTHHWTHVTELLDGYFDLESPAIKDRLQLYDLRTAAYKLCAAMCGRLPYLVQTEEGDRHVCHTPEDLGNLPAKAVMNEIRQKRGLVQWLSVFYHENPHQDFSGQGSYEHALEQFLLQLGEYDSSEMHYKRFAKAEEQLQRKIEDSHDQWSACIRRQKVCMGIIGALSLIWMLLVLVPGIATTDLFRTYIYYYVCIPVGTVTAMALVLWSYFRGHGFLICTFWAIFGAALSAIPAALLDVCCSMAPALVRWVTLLVSGGYIGFALRACMKKSEISRGEVGDIFRLDPEKALTEKLFYTFRTRTFKFRASNFGMLDDVIDESQAASYEKLLTCITWGALPLVLVILFVWYHPALMDHSAPDIEAWKQAIWDLVGQIKNTK